MESAILNALPNISVGVASVAALAYVTRLFILRLQEQSETHAQSMKEREDYLREVEREVRNTIMEQLHRSTTALEKSNDIISKAIKKIES